MIQFDLKLFDKQEELDLTSYLILLVLNEEPDRLNQLSKNHINLLENNHYIRIIDGECIMDSKAIKLFESNPLAMQAKEVLEYMNRLKESISKRPFKYSTHGKDILPRLNEGNSVEDIKRMLDYKYREWTNTDFQIYLRPSTLFNKTKFYNYMEQDEVNKNKIDIRQSKMDDDD